MRGSVGLLLALSLAPVGCAGYRAVERSGPEELAWPAQDPRIRLQSVIDLGEGLESGPRRLLNRIADRAAPVPFERPYALAWDDEHLLVADPGAGRVASIAPGGRVALSAEGLFRQPIGIAACRSGIVVTDAAAGTVTLLDRELRLERRLVTGMSRPTGVVCAGDRLFVVETAAHRVRVMESDGDWRTVGDRGEMPGDFNYPTSIAVDGATLLVGDTLNFRIQRLDPESGDPIGAFGRLGDSPGEMPRIKGVAVDRLGHVWVSDAHLDRVSVYDPDGRLLISIGRRGEAAGEFSFPAGIAAHPDGRIAVADSLNRRVQVFRVLDDGGRS